MFFTVIAHYPAGIKIVLPKMNLVTSKTSTQVMHALLAYVNGYYALQIPCPSPVGAQLETLVPSVDRVMFPWVDARRGGHLVGCKAGEFLLAGILKCLW